MKLRSEGALIQEVVEETGIPRSTLHRWLDRGLEGLLKPKALSPQSTSPLQPPTPSGQQTSRAIPADLSRILNNLRKRLEKLEHMMNKSSQEEYREESQPRYFRQRVFRNKLPRPETSLMAPKKFIRMFKDSLGLSSLPIPNRMDIVRVKCPRCRKDLMIKVPWEFKRISREYCPNCGSLNEVTWVGSEEYL